MILANWEWHVDTQKWDKRHYPDTGAAHPTCGNRGGCGGTYNVRTWEESTTTYSTDSDGNTTYDTTYDKRYEYDHDEWVHYKTFSLTGKDKHPTSPNYSLDYPQTAARKQKQSQVGGIRRLHRVFLSCEDGKDRIWITTEPLWMPWDKGDNCSVVTTGFGEVKRLLIPGEIE